MASSAFGHRLTRLGGLEELRIRQAKKDKTYQMTQHHILVMPGEQR